MFLLRRPYLFVCIALLTSLSMMAQEAAVKLGKLEVEKDVRVDSLLLQRLKMNELKAGTPGYRIQIYFGNQRNKAIEQRTEFLKRHPDIGAYLMYQQPNFKVRVGDFRTRLEAYRLYRQLAGTFAAAFIVKDDIRLQNENYNDVREQK